MTQRPKANGQQQAVHSGAEGARTPDLLGAIQALSQLSYSPVGRLNVNVAPPTSNPLEPNVSVPLSKPWGVGSGEWYFAARYRMPGSHRRYHSPLPTLLRCLVGKTPIVLSPTSL